MQFTKLSPKQSINKAYLKEKVSRADIELLKRNLNTLFENTARTGDEEHLKSQITYFLRDTWYHGLHQINPLEKNDLVIHTGKSANDPVGIIIEVKSLTNRSEMVTPERPNTKAFHELVLYYLRERIEKKNNEIKFLIATNTDQWFILDANEFDKKIYRNPAIRRLYDVKVKDHKDNPFFYDELKKLLDESAITLEATCFSLEDFRRVAQNSDPKDDQKLIPLFKVLSPVHLLKQPFANDSNSLQPRFYSELLHLIGLTEVKEGSKKLIQRKKEGERNAGSLLESTIIQLDTHDKISRISKPSQYGDKYDERLYNVALELVITWVNRILFLKLLEAQLLSYHQQDREYTFLNKEKIKDFDDLDKLFFSVLAKKPGERREDINKVFSKVPYLNSSLFEPTELEHVTLFINGLEDRVSLPLMASTVLKDGNGRPLKGSLETLDYLFSFLNSYDFSSEGSEDIQEDNKTLINASVLGLIFEKINGYKDGSFFTPGFITMYMCRETIRRAVVQKFNEAKGWSCQEFSELYDQIEDRAEANEIINSLKICDPAVGSGHFLVSALNEILAIKHDLKVLQDREGHRLKEYQVEVVNDELVVTDEEGSPFYYNPRSRESQRVQETLFHEKQTIIENCLFGVDINPNSVKICRLRLWIELLKNAYYKATGTEGHPQLETLPNIDINIKTGNSLISRFSLDADLKQALKKSRFSIDAYKIAVQTYRNAQNKEQKREMEQLISTIKSDFRTEINSNDPKVKKLDKLSGELYAKYQANQLFDAKLTAAQKKDRDKLTAEINKLSAEIKEIKENRIYENAFEWRFEFPEVLNEEGDFVGFDVVIGNPPYVFGGSDGISGKAKDFYKRTFISGAGKINLFTLFIEQSFRVLAKSGKFSFIIPNTFLRVTSYNVSRKLLVDNYPIHSISDYGNSVFDDAITTAVVLVASKVDLNESNTIRINNNGRLNTKLQTTIREAGYVISLNVDDEKQALIQKLKSQSTKLGELCREMIFGVVITKNKDAVVSNIPHEGWKPFLEGKDIGPFFIKPIHSYLNYQPELLHRARSKHVFEAKEKLLFQRITGGLQPLKVAYDEMGYYNKESINNVILKDDCGFECKYILALVNSTLINWFYTNQFTNESKLTVNLSKEYLSEIPISNNSDREALLELTEKVLRIKKVDHNADITKELKQIDQLVYQLYDLTEEEIRIIEGGESEAFDEAHHQVELSENPG